MSDQKGTTIPSDLREVAKLRAERFRALLERGRPPELRFGQLWSILPAEAQSEEV
jgi:hypothetical protein